MRVMMCPKTTRVGKADPGGLAGIRTEISLGQVGQQQVGGHWARGKGGRHRVCRRDKGWVHTGDTVGRL